MGSGVRDIAVTMGSRIGALLPMLALQSCLAWFLEPSGRGLYAVCMMFAAFLTVVCLFGSDAAGNYFIASKQFNVSEGVVATLGVGTVGALLATTFGLLAIRLPLEVFRSTPHRILLLSIFLTVFQLWSTSLLLLLTAVRAFSYRGMVHLLQPVLRLAGTLVFVKLLGLGVGGALLANIVSAGVVIVVILRFFRRRFFLRFAPPAWRQFRRLVAYGARYYLASLSTMMNAQIGVLMLAVLAIRPSEIGFFAAGVALMTHVTMIADAVGSVLHPRVAGDEAGRPELTARCARLVGMLSGAIVLLLAVLATPLVTLLLSPRFLPAVPVMWIVAPGVAARAVTKIIVPYLNGTDHPGVFSFATVCSTVLNFALVAVLCPRLGYTGAAWALTGSALVGAIMMVLAFRKLSGLTWAQAWLPTTADWTTLVNVWRKGLRRRGPLAD